MTTETLYNSDDGLKFDTEEHCSLYEAMVLNPIQRIEEKYLGERIKRNVGWGQPPCTEYKKHIPQNIILCAYELFDVCRKIQNYRPAPGYGDDFAEKIMEEFRNLQNTPTENYEEKKSTFWSVLIWLKEICKVYVGDDKYFNYEDSISMIVLERLRNCSITTGIEYPETKWVNREDDWKRYVEQINDYVASGGKFR